MDSLFLADRMMIRNVSLVDELVDKDIDGEDFGHDLFCEIGLGFRQCKICSEFFHDKYKAEMHRVLHVDDIKRISRLRRERRKKSPSLN